MNYTVYRNWALWAVQGMTALGFVGAAIQKLEGEPAVMRTFDALGWGTPPRMMLAVLELVGAVALLVPVLAGAAGCGFVALTICATAVQLSTGESVAPPLVLLVLAAIVAWGRRGSIGALHRVLTTRLNAGMP